MSNAISNEGESARVLQNDELDIVMGGAKSTVDAALVYIRIDMESIIITHVSSSP